MSRPKHKRIGRPTMDPKSAARVTIRLGPGDVDALDALATELGGANLSEALRHLVRAYAKARKGARKS